MAVPGDPVCTGSRYPTMHKELIQLAAQVYRNNGHDVTVVDQQPGPQTLRVRSKTEEVEDHISVRIIPYVQKPGVILTKLDDLLKMNADVHLVVDSVDAADRLSEILRIPFLVRIWCRWCLLQPPTTVFPGQIQNGLRRTDMVGCHD